VNLTLTLTLPLPPSANNYWRSVTINGHVRVLVSREAREYVKRVAAHALFADAKPMAGPVKLSACVFRKQRRGDLLNFEKVLCDALEGVAYVNDSQIIEAHFYLRDDKHNPRVEVEVTEIPA
jgi:crossover junction endodeoxyribonuclease RusA